MVRTRLPFLFAAGLAACLLQQAAAEPEITGTNFRGLRIGHKTTLQFQGYELGPRPQVLLPVPIASQTVKPGATPENVAIEIELAQDIHPGIYPLWLITAREIAPPIFVGIDELPQAPISAELSQLPVALHGRIGGTAIARTSFQGKKGERIVVDVEARRLGSDVQPNLRLLDPRGTQIAWSHGRVALWGDPRIEATLPKDGRYQIELHELAYQGGRPNEFRLKAGKLHYADFVFPLGAQRGTKAKLQFAGTSATKRELPAVDLSDAVFAVPVRLPPQAGFTGTPPTLRVSDFPNVVEPDGPQGEMPQAAVPAALNGRLLPGEEDRFRLQVAPKSRLRMEVFAHRAGSPLDSVLLVRDENGRELARNDDQAETVDPGLDLTVPDSVKQIVVALRGRTDAGGPDYLYRIEVTQRQPDFALRAENARLGIPQGGAALLRVTADRQGYGGPIRLDWRHLPQGVQPSAAEIPAGANSALITLTAASGAQPDARVAALQGSSADGRLVRAALVPEFAAASAQPWLRKHIAVAVLAAAPLSVAWAQPPKSLSPGSKVSVAIHLNRRDGANGPVRLSLLTSQPVPLKKKGNEQVPDLAQALRLQSAPLLKPGEPVPQLTILVPPKLPNLPYDLVLKAELLENDEVVATAYTPSVRLTAGD